jgi:RNA recognition motif-containing protein
MGKKLYVGNLPYSVRDGDLEQAFGQFGSVTSAKVMMERDTGRSKGFGFVEMGTDEEAQSAINGMNGQPLGGRSVVVNEARPMEERPPRSGGGGFGGGGRREGGGGYGGGGGGYGGGRREGGGESGFRSPYGSGPRGGGNGGGGRREGGGGGYGGGY